jgi:hypothetical protein
MMNDGSRHNCFLSLISRIASRITFFPQQVAGCQSAQLRHCFCMVEPNPAAPLPEAAPATAPSRAKIFFRRLGSSVALWSCVLLAPSGANLFRQHLSPGDARHRGARFQEFYEP